MVLSSWCTGDLLGGKTAGRKKFRGYITPRKDDAKKIQVFGQAEKI